MTETVNALRSEAGSHIASARHCVEAGDVAEATLNAAMASALFAQAVALEIHQAAAPRHDLEHIRDVVNPGWGAPVTHVAVCACDWSSREFTSSDLAVAAHIGHQARMQARRTG